MHVPTRPPKKEVLKIHQNSLHKKIKFKCNECDNQFTQKGHLKTHKISVHMEELGTNAMNVLTRILKKEISKFIKTLSIRKSSLNAMHVKVNSLGKIVSKPIKPLFIRKSSSNAMNVIFSSLKKVI